MLRPALVALVSLALLALSASPAGAGPLPPGGTFVDDDGSVHEPAIEAVAAAGVTVGCGSRPARFCPGEPVTRAQMAAFLLRAIGHDGHTRSPRGYFADVPTGAWFARAVEHLFEHAITRGCAPDRFCPDAPVTRGQMATFLVRTFDLAPSGTDRFDDDDASVHEADIEAMASAGITVGCSTGRFCPGEAVTRDQMASFLVRAMGLAPIDPPPGFYGAVHEIDHRLATRMSASWRPGCPVPISHLRYLELDHWGFDEREHRGEIVVHRDWADRILDVFERLFDAGFPIRRMRLVDDYGGDDRASMDANNTSGFNCRAAQGSTSFSEHAYGRAIDINPVQNPYVRGATVLPAAGARYLDRTVAEQGMVQEGDVVVRSFGEIGWGWGGRWVTLKDWQHFSATGR